MILMPGELPKNCVGCPCWNEYAICECQLGVVGDKDENPATKRLSSCPLEKAPTIESATAGMAKAILALVETMSLNNEGSLDTFMDELENKVNTMGRREA